MFADMKNTGLTSENIPLVYMQKFSDSVRLMMTSSNDVIIHVTGHLCEEFTSHRRIPRTKASDTELWCFLWSVPE